MPIVQADLSQCGRRGIRRSGRVLAYVGLAEPVHRLQPRELEIADAVRAAAVRSRLG